MVKAGSLERAAVTQQEADVEIPARRGSITDVNGNDLAVSEPAMDIAATTYLIKDATKVAAQLAPLIGVGEDVLLRKLAKPSGFVYLGRGIPAEKADQAKKLKIPGLEYIPRYRRDYPREWTAAQLIGSTGTDDQGLGGLEYRLDKQLGGTDGERRLVKDGGGNPIEMRDTKPVKPGHTVRLTLDANLQDRAEAVLGEVGKAWKPKGATAIVMEPNTGAILALANWPRVNANALEEAPADARTNQAVGVTYEPGSTFKAFTVAAALEDGKVTPDTKFGIPPMLQVADREITDAEDHGYETKSVSEILKVSSNIGAVLIAQKVKTAPFDAWIHKWGFGKPTGVDLPGEQRGLVLPLEGLLRRDDGQPADRPGHRGDADADGRGLRGDRQRRHPARAAHRGLGRRSQDGAAQGPARDLRGHRGVGAQDARGRDRPGRHRLRRRDQGLQPGRQDRHGREGVQRRVLQGQVRRVVRRLRARGQAEAAGRGRRRRAQRRDLRRPGRRTGLARDRQLRTGLPEDRVPIRLDGVAIETHAPVFNQSVPFEDVDLLAGDPALREALEREGAGWATELVREAGLTAASAVAQAHSRRAERNEPRLITHDRFGHRVDTVELDPSWHWLLDGAVSRQIHALPWADPRPGAHVARAALEFVWTHANAGVMCPISMTYSAVPALRVDPSIAGEWEPRLIAGALCGMAMTEKQGGSDVRANTTAAEPVGDGWFELTGHKWFCSYPPCDIFLVLAQAPAGLSCFVLERGAGMEFQRLKDKLGTRSLPSSEVEFRARARAAAGRGGPRRGDDHRDGHPHAAGLRDRQRRRGCAAASPRRSGTRATAPRSARGWSTSPRWSTCSRISRWNPRRRRPRRCASRAPTTRATTRCGASPRRSRSTGSASARRRTRSEALECLGGNGYVEESPMPRLLRDAPLNGIWEGSGNVIALDVLRALSREPDGLEAFRAECELARGGQRGARRPPRRVARGHRPLERPARGRGARSGLPGVAAGAPRARVRLRRVLRRPLRRRRPRLRHAPVRRRRRGDRRSRA